MKLKARPMPDIEDHPLRYAMANELHARPFPGGAGPGAGGVSGDQAGAECRRAGPEGADRAHLIALLDRFGAAHPQPAATHYSGQIGKHLLKWESHTEFVTFTVFRGWRRGPAL